MHTRLCYLALSAAFALLLAASAASAWDSGLNVSHSKRLYVIIENINENARQLGLDVSMIRAKVELQLRRYGIIAIQHRETDDAYLYVNITASGDGPYGYSIHVAVHREVTYMVDGKLYDNIAATWDRGSAGVLGRHAEGRAQFIMSSLSNHLDVFINEYLKANDMPAAPLVSR